MNTQIVQEQAFRGSHQGKEVSLYTLENSNGLIAQITNYGAIVVNLLVPDKKGQNGDIVLGFDTLQDYIQGNEHYMGAICGRVASRIALGRFTLLGKEYQLAVNNGPNHLHGGITGFSKKVWDVTAYTSSELRMELISAHGEEGYPGTIRASVVYTLTEQNELQLDYKATTDSPTLINLASHCYFNLAGEGSGCIGNHELMICGDFFTPTNETLIPTGEIRSVHKGPMDFSRFKKMGRDIDLPDEQLIFGHGYDHNWVLNHPANTLGLAAVVAEPVSGRVMEIYTTQPGIQFYTSNWMDGVPGKAGKKYGKREAFCLETQHFANAINLPHFPSTILGPGEVYKHTVVHRFRTQ
jgi:aldose 1-epimerase